MQNLFFRYIFRQALTSVLLIIITLSGVVWIALALRQLDVVTGQGQNAATLFIMTTLSLPNLMAIIAPFALLIGVMHTLHRLSGDSELIVITASGGSIWVLGRPIIILATIVMGLLFLTNHIFMPWSMRELRQYILKVRTDLLGQVLQPGSFSSPEQGLTFHIRERDRNGDILGLLVHDTRKEQQVTSYLAEKAIITQQENNAFLIMTDGHVISQENRTSPQRIVSFDKYVFNLDTLDKKTNDEIDLNPRERYFDELVNPDPDSKQFKIQPGQFISELHERFSNPLYPMAFALIAIAAIGTTRSTRQNNNLNFAIGLVAAAGLKVSSLALFNIVVIKTKLFPLLYALPLFVIAITFFFILQNKSQKKFHVSKGVPKRFFNPSISPFLKSFYFLKNR